MRKLRKTSRKYYLRQIVCSWLVFCMLFVMPARVAMAIPNPGSDTLPSGIIDSRGVNAPVINGLNMGITQTAGEAIINWNNFDIGADAGVEFIQPGSAAAVLNRVHDGNVTGIMGSLSANGRVFVVNPAGIVFGESAVVNVSQLVASGLDITDDDFMKGVYKFSGGSGMVSNYGQITAEQVALIGRKVLNAGVIEAPAGCVIMAAGDKVFLGSEGSDVVVEVTGVTLTDDTDAAFKDGDVINEGTIEASGGKIVLAAGDTWSRAIGGIDGSTVAVDGGTGRVGQFGTLNVDSVDADGGSITLTAADVVVLGEDSVSTANAGTNSDGGDVVVYSPGTALFREGALVEAKGGSESGDGGFFELSGKEDVEIEGQIDLAASSGQNGEFLIDPRNVKIVSGSSNQGNWDGSEWDPKWEVGYAKLDIDTLEGYLVDQDVTITTDGFSIFQAGWVWFDAGRDVQDGVGGGSDNSLTVNAHDSILLDSGINFTGIGDVTLNARKGITTNAEINLTGGHLEMLGGQTSGGADININESITAGSIRIKNGKDISPGEQSYSGVYLAEDKTLTSSAGNVVVEAVHDIVLGGDVTANGGDIFLNADEDGYGDPKDGSEGYNPRHYGGGDLLTKKLTADGDIDLLGNAIQLDGAVTSGGDLTITGRTSKDSSGSTLLGPDAYGDVHAMGTLNAADNIDISVTSEESEWIDGYWSAGTWVPGHWKGWCYVRGHWEDRTWVEGYWDQSYYPGTITLDGDVTAGGDIKLFNDTYTTNVTGHGVTLTAGDDIELKNSLDPYENSTFITGEKHLGLIAGDKIKASSTVISVTGSSILMQQNRSLDTADYTFGNQENTDLTLISDNGSVTADFGANAANKWASIGAHANQNITLARSNGKITIELGNSGMAGRSLWAENGYIDIDGFNVKNSSINPTGSLEAGTTLDIDVVHGINLGGDITSGGNMGLRADTDRRYGQDVVVGGNINSGGNLGIDATNVDIQSAHSAGDMDLYAHGLYDKTAPPDEPLIGSGDVHARGTLSTTDGHIQITATDFGSSSATTGPTFESLGDTSYSATGTIYLDGDVTANGGLHDDVLLNSNTVAAAGVKIESTGDDVILAPGKTMHGRGNLTVKADDDVKLGGIDGDDMNGSAGDVTAKYDLTITAGDDVYAHGNLESTRGDIDIYSGDDTIHLENDYVKAHDDVTLHNNTLANDGVLIKADDNVRTSGKLTGYGDLTVKAGDDIQFGDDVLVEKSLVAESGLDHALGIFTSGKGSIEAAGDITAGDMLLSAGAGLPGYSDSHVSVAGKLTANRKTEGSWWKKQVISEGNITVEAHHNVTLGGAVEADGDLVINADRHDNWPDWTPDHMKGGDVEVAGTVDAGGTIDMYGNKIMLKGDVTSRNDMTITGNTSEDWKGDPGDVYAKGNLESTRGSINISADDGTIHLQNEHVKAHDDVTLHNNTVANDGVLIKADDNVRTSGKLTGYGDLTVKAGDDIQFGDDVVVEKSLVAKSGLDHALGIFTSGKGSIEAAGDITAGDMLLSAGAGLPGYSNSHVTVAGDLTTTAGNMIVEAHHDITIGAPDNVDSGNVNSAGKLVLNADRHDNWWAPDDIHMKGGDVEVAGTVDAVDTIDMYGNNIKLHQDVVAGGDMTLTGDTSSDFKDALPQGDVTAMGNLTSTGGSISIYSSDDTTYLGGDVTALNNVLLNNNTEFTSADDQTVWAKTGSVTANGYLEKGSSLSNDEREMESSGSLYLLAKENISLADHVTVENGGISIISEEGKIFTPDELGGETDTLNVDISGTSNRMADVGVDLPKDYDQPAPEAAGEYETGKAAIVIMSEKALKLGPDGTLTARGTYYDDGSVDDRPGVDFANYSRPDKPGGDPIDIAIYLASNSREPIDLPTYDYEGDVHVGSPVADLPDGAVMVVDAYDTVTFGEKFEDSLKGGNIDWLEVCSRISDTFEFAWDHDKLPKQDGAWDISKFVWRGEGGGDDGGAWVLKPLPPAAPLAQFAAPRIEGCPELVQAVATELGITADTIQVGIGNAIALNPSIQACQACATLVDAASILRDEDGLRMAAMVQMFNVLAPADAPFTPETAASIAMAFKGAAEGSQYASVMEYVDAFAQYVDVLDIELGSPVGNSVAFVMEKYGAGVTDSDNANIAAFIAIRLEAIGG